MLQKTQGIVLNYTRYSESSVIAHMYTDIFGRQSFICSGIKGKKSKNRLVYFQPLSLVEMEVYAKEKNELFRIKEIKHTQALYSITGDIRKSTIALFIAELLYKTLHESESNEALFSFLNSSIQFLEHMEHGISNFHLVFMIQLSKHVGIFPRADFESMSGMSSEADEKYFERIPPKTKDHFAEIYRSSFQNIQDIKLNHKERFDILTRLIDYYKMHFNTLESIKSLSVLQELFKE